MDKKLSIAILLPCHLRTWRYCRTNFLENLYDPQHSIDVFVDTYYNDFRMDMYAKHEKHFAKILTETEIKELLQNINVVSLNIEQENNADAGDEQKRKILQIVRTLEEQENQYDLVVRSRFDILVQEKVDYSSIYRETEEEPNLIHLGKGSVNGINDMFAVCRSEVFSIYGNRFDLVKTVDPHRSLFLIEALHGVKYKHSIPTAAVRIGADGKYRIEKSGMLPEVLENFEK
jgi:oligoribonuclease NrnB/cAMP/cGMP phosphodiesterase (DHH superfamily)